MNRYVLDASVVAAWLLPNQATPASDALLERAPDVDFIAPRLFAYEVRRIVLKAERLGQLAPNRANLVLDDLFSGLPISVEADLDDEGLLVVQHLARRETLSFYDALYLDLAMVRGVPVASRDRALLEATRRNGLDVIDVRASV